MFTYSKWVDVAEKEEIQICIWAPVENNLAYVKDNDLYYLKSTDNTGVGRRLTNDGEPGVIYNGTPDWVYEGLCYFLLKYTHLVYKRKVNN